MGEMIKQGAIKIIEVVGVSEKSFEDAVVQAITKASNSVEGISGAEIVKFTASVNNGNITQFRADVKLAFPVK